MRKKIDNEFIIFNETNNFSEFQIFKAEQYAFKEIKKSPDEIISIDEIAKDCQPNTKASTVFSNSLNDINKIKPVSTSNTASIIGKISSIAIKSAILVISASGIGALNIFNNDIEIIANDSLSYELKPDIIQVNGKFNKYDEGTKYYACLSQFINNEIVNNDERIKLHIENDTFSFSSLVNYGIDSYQYDIISIYENDEKIIYSSPIILYNVSQDYNAYYDKVSLEECEITLNESDAYSIKINTNFESYYGNIFSYSLTINDENHNTLASYSGCDKIIELNVSTIDNLTFVYKDIATFNNTMHVYNEYEITSSSFIMDKSIYVDEDINQITINGKIINYNSNINYQINLNEYYNDEIITSHTDLPLIINDNGYFACNVAISYGITNFDYEIYYFDNDIKNILYTSGLTTYSINQDYAASYNKVSPTDSLITFNDDDTITISINTGFTTTNENVFKYKLSIKNKEGEIIDSYIGCDSQIEFNINQDGQLFFEYSDIGIFNNSEHEYNKISIEAPTIIKKPSFSLNDNFTFNGDFFVISYNLDTIYDKSSFNINLEMKNNIGTFTKEIFTLNDNNEIILDTINGEPNELIISGTISFTDPILDKHTHSISFASKSYTMSYSFDVTSVNAEVYDESSTTIPITLSFEYLLPNTYKINISSTSTLIDETIQLNSTYYSNKLSKTDGGIIDIKVLDNNNTEIVKKEFTIFPKSTIIDYYTNVPNYLCTNPSDSVITYNEDNTINIYRKMLNDETIITNENIYYDAFIYTNESEINGNKIYLNPYHNLSNSKFSILENITDAQYIFNYFTVLKYNNVNYYMELNYPSGVANNAFNGNVKGMYNADSNTTAITLINNNYGAIKNDCIIDNTHYTFDLYESQFSESYTLTFNGNAIGKNISCFYSNNSTNYDNYASSLQMKGELYKKIDITIAE